MNFGMKMLYSVGLVGLFFLMLPKAARADDFDFSITNTDGTTPGTITGEIFGLTNDGTAGSATEVLITGYPAGDASIIGSSSLNATSWDDQLDNSFTETGGSITSAIFWAIDGTNPDTPDLFIGIEGANGFSIPGTAAGTYNYGGTDGITFTAVTPEPGTISLMMTGVGLLGVMVVLRKRKLQALAQSA
jgi:hypothetical protein